MKSIAAELSVSRSAVSFVLAGEAERRRINPETARRILQRARELGFRPNYFAQALNTGKTGAIGLVFPDVHEAYMAEMLRGIDLVFADHEVTMMLSSSRMDRLVELKNVESLLYRGIDGLIIVPCADFNGRPTAIAPLRSVLAGTPIPVVCADRIPRAWTGSSVVQDDRRGARLAVERLIDHGAERVACISFDLDVSSVAARIAGYHDALAGRQKKTDPQWLILLDQVDALAGDLSAALQDLLCRPAEERPDAWFVTTAGLSYRTRDLLSRLSAPGDPPALIARFGVDPAYFSSGMISVVQPHREIGRRSAELLFAHMANPELPPQQIVLPNVLTR
ncbi:MAG: LacI family DNA-binding transcriptional regulator [Propionivibrio sp.]